MSATGPNEHLLVPLYVDAVAIVKGTPPEEAFADLTPDFDLLDSQIALGAYCSPQKIPTARLKRPLEAGIHLHWALPSALTHGEQRQGDRTPTFYRVPNRWLIVRIPSKRDDPKTSAAWLLESDRLSEDNTAEKNWYGPTRDGSYYARVLGAWYAYEDWRQRTEPAASLEREKVELTAIGAGNPFFAAFYPGCRNVFGVWDPLTGLDEGCFTYLVAGWYSQQEDDPLHVMPARADESRYETHKRANLEDLKKRWALNAHAYPSATLCHGAVHAVKWKRSGSPSGIPEGQVEIAFGNNGAEALSALIRKRTGRPSLVEPLLCAFQYDMLADARHIPGIAEVDDEVHRREFTPVDGGSRWAIEPIERADVTSPAEKTLPPFPTDPAVGSELGKLIALQELHDRLKRRLSALQWDYHALWFKQRLDDEGGFDTQSVQRELTDKRTDISTIASRVRTTGAEIQGLVQTRFARDFAMQVVDGNLPSSARASDKIQFRLVKTEAPRFWLANEPTVLLSGPAVKVSDKHGNDDGNALNCRVLDQVATDMRFGEQRGELAVQADGQPLLKGLTALGSILTRETKERLPWTALGDLYVETVLLDPASRVDMAHLAYRNYSNQQVGDTLIGNLARSIEQAQDAVREAQSTDAPLRGAYTARGGVPAALPPPFSVRVWEPAWSPLFMIWRVDWKPFTGQPAGAEFDARWSFADGRRRDYRLIEAANAGGPATQYSGWVPLNPSLSRQFLDRIKGAPPEIAARVGRLLLQPLSGLSSALVTREEVLQLPPLGDNRMILGDVLDLIGGHAMSSSPKFPAYGPRESAKFYPLRNGQVQMRDLWIVDAFGQLQKIVPGRNNDVILADTLAPLDGGGGAWIPLSPRIMQPARLTFQWLSARVEPDAKPRPSDSDPATSPICGWIVPNHWEESITVLDVSGRVLGKLQKIADGGSLEWVSWPPVSLASASAPPDEAKLGNQDLARFISALHARGAGALGALLRLAREVQLNVSSPASPGASGLGFLAAEPLVLAKASLALELADPPVVDQRVSNTQSLKDWTESVTFPVRLGDQRKRKDGLVGYFVDGSYDRFRPAFEATAGDDSYFDRSSLLELQPFFPDSDAPAAANKRAKVLTLLLDAKAGVFASCPVVPSEFLELSSYISRNTIAEMDLVIDVAPVIGVARELRLPVPDDGSGQWSWGQFEQPEDDKPPAWKTNDRIARKDVADGVPAESAEVLEGWIALHALRASDAKPQS